MVGGASSGRLRQARRRALRIAAAEDGRRLRRRVAARHRCRSHRLGSDGPRPRHPDLPQPDQGLGRGGLRLSAAVGRRGRYAEDGDRRPRRGRRHQGAAAGQDHLRTGEAERTEGGADRTGAAEHLHQLGRQYRPRRNRAGADRISGAGRSNPATNSRCGCRWWSPRATIPRPSCRASTSGPMAAAGARPNPIPCRTATASRPRCSTPRPTRRSIRPASPCGCRPASRSARSRAITTRSRRKRPMPARSIIRLAEGPVPADRDFELTWKPAAEKAPSVGLFREHVGDSDYLLAFVTPPSVEQAAAEAAAARGHLRDRQFRLDGRRLDHPGQGEPHLRARPPAAERPLQRDPLRSHHGCAVPGGRAGRQGAYRPGHLLCRRAAGQWRHRNGAGDARRAVRQRRAMPATSGRSCS